MTVSQRRRKQAATALRKASANVAPESQTKAAPPPSYRALLRDLGKRNPLTTNELAKADIHRRATLSRYLTGVRLAGFEELINHLAILQAIYAASPRLKPIAFLVQRARLDFQQALEATLSGFPSVAHDAMRDVMEIEFLLRDFYFEPEHIKAWLTCADPERYNRFRPAVLRQRHAQRIGKKPQDLGEAHDYKAHSASLHVSPVFNPFGGPGMRKGVVPWSEDAGFMEIFEHATRLLHAAHRLRRKCGRRSKGFANQHRALRNVRLAWNQTQQMQMIMMAVVTAAQEIERETATGELQRPEISPN